MSMTEGAKKWVAALRSGDYDQVAGFLHTKEGGKDRFCCLGVACVLYNEEHPDSPLAIGGSDLSTDAVSYNGVDTALPKPVQDWLGLRTNTGRFSVPIDGRSHLTDLNDVSGFSFSKIADVIESEPRDLFAA